MRILLASETYHPDVNGAAYFTYRLATSLTSRGHNVFVMCPSRSFRDTISNEKGVTIHGLRSIPVPMYRNFRISSPFISRVIRRLVKQISPDIVHIQNHFLIGRQALRAARKLGIPVMGTNHFMPENLVHYLHLSETGEKLVQESAWRDCVRVFEQLDCVTTPTETAASLLRRAGLNKDVRPISCGIDLDRFSPTNDGSYLKRRFAIPDNKLVLLYVGRLDKEKRIDAVLRALVHVVRFANAHLVLAGTGRERQRLRELTVKLGIQQHVTFTGFVPDEDLQNIYRIADLFVIAGIAELQSIVTMEAMASGLPVVAVNAMALPELVHDGDNGYLFSDGNSQMLAEKVIAILSNQSTRAQMSTRSLEIIRHHDINRVVEQYESVYEELVHH